MNATVATTRLKKRVLRPIQEEDVSKKKRKRIPVAEIYWKKGDYMELVEDPFNLN